MSGGPDVIALLRALVAIPSVSGDEAACRDALAAWLVDHGIVPEIHGRNLLATVEGEAGPGKGLLLCSHYDVVPVGAGWTRDPWEPSLEDGRVYGRGSNDAKSSVAAMAVAAASLDRSTLAGRLVLAFVCDEETGGEGIEACVDALPDVDACVVGEPTGLDVCRGQRGLLRAHVVARGRACHASRPWEGSNALTAAARDMLAIEALDLGEADELLGPATLVPTMVEGGTRPNVMPGECTVQLDGRSTAACDNDALEAALRGAVQGEVVVTSRRFQPVVTAADAPLVRQARAASPTGVVRAFGGVSDLFHLRHVPGVIVGPGTSAASHAPDEWVATEQVEAATNVYGQLARSWLGVPETAAQTSGVNP
jgi:acetylornithine deacetylase